MKAVLAVPSMLALLGCAHGVGHAHYPANEAQLVLHTRYDTEVRWGQPHDWRGFEAPVEKKLANLQHVYERYGRVDAGQPWIDLRFDKVLRPEDDASAAAIGR